MIHRSFVVRRPRRTAVVAATTLTAALTTTLTGGLAGGAASAAAPPDPSLACTPYDDDSNLDSDALGGMAVTGLTTSTGTTPEEFSGTVLGVIDDGIAPGIDMIMARLTSPEIDRVHGIWAGMSGSPVYAPDGTLLGAVAYGLSFGPSPVAGITPAAAMFDVADRASAAAPAGKVRIPARLQREIVGHSRVSPRAADAGMSPLKTPLGVSGVPSDMKLRKVKRKLGVTDVKMFRSSPAPVSASATAAEEIVPGGNVAAGISYGEVSLIGYGTATAVCNGEVIGFGHPFDYSGKTTLTMHGGSTVYVQEDPVFGSFKVVNPSAPVGTITQDRLAGIAGPLQDLPDSTVVTTTITEDADGDLVADPGERTRTSGETHVSNPYWLDYVTWVAQLLNAEVVFDNFGPGTATTQYTIKGSTGAGAGTPFTLTRGNRFQSDFSIPFDAAFDVADTIWTLYQNRFTDVDFDKVTTNTVMSNEARLFRVKGVELKKDGKWTTLRQGRAIRAEAGSTLTFRVTLGSYRDRFGTRTEKLQVRVPEVNRRSFGFLTIGGSDDFGFGRRGAKSFAALVKSIESAPRNDDLVGELYVRERRSPTVRRTFTEPAGDVVRGNRFYELNIQHR